MVEGLRNLSETVVAHATFVNSQLEDGWTKLEVVTNENVTDTIQAEAAGMAEGALTWKFLTEYYKEFYVNDVCKKEPGACEWISGQLKKNAEYIRRTVVANSSTDSYWHHVGLFYKQMEGLVLGYQAQAQLRAASDPGVQFNTLKDVTKIVTKNHLESLT